MARVVPNALSGPAPKPKRLGDNAPQLGAAPPPGREKLVAPPPVAFPSRFLVPKKVLTAALAACLFLLIVGAKWATFDRYGSPMPDWDQWDAEAGELFIPWFENDHFVQHLFHPHNEHRVILTKLQNLALGLLNGQWDSRLEAVSNALLHAALAAAFWVCGRCWFAAASASTTGSPATATPAGPFTSRLLGLLWFLVVATLFGLPLAWQNILGGFHSQQFWLLGLSFAAIVTLPFARPGGGAWWLGLLSALLALGSMGSGFLAAVVVLLVLGWRLARRQTGWRNTWLTLLLLAAVVALGAATRVEVEWHQKLKAATAHDFVFSIIHSLQWPLRDRHWAAAVLWLPWVLAAWRVLRAPPADTATTRAGQAIVALGGWVLVQVFATAYARGAGADYPASRYMDTLAFGATANAAALGWLLAAGASSRLVLAGRTLVALGWLVTLGLGLHTVTDRNLRYELPDARKYYDKAEGHMRRYLASNDKQQLAYPDIPFPSAEGLIDRLANRHLRALMPVPIRTPLVLAPAPRIPNAETDRPVFLFNNAQGADIERPPRLGLSPATPPLDYTPTWGSFAPTDPGAAATGTWRSAPLTVAGRRWLKFELAGPIGEPGAALALELRDATTDALLADVRPSRVPGDTWRAVYVRAPRVPFVLVARDADPARWLAFSGPVEMGVLSYWARQAARHSLLLLYGAAAASALLGLLAWRGPGAAPGRPAAG